MTRSPRSRKLTREEFLERFEGGESLKSIAEDFPASWQTVRSLTRSESTTG